MALGTPTLGTAAYAGHPATTIDVPYPASIAAGDVLILVTGQQDRSGFIPTFTPPAGWTLQGESAHAGGYGLGSGGNDTGDSTVRFFTKDTVAGGETGNVSCTTTGAEVTWANIIRVPSGAGSFLYGFAHGADTTAGSVSATMGSDPGFTTGDRAIWAMCIPTDVTTPSQFSAHNITATGATFGTKTELREFDSALSEDIGGYLAWAPVSSGTSSAAPVITATAGGTTTNVRGPVAVIRVREDASGPFTYNESLTETGTAAQTATTAATFPNAQSESATSAASQGVGLSMPASQSEALTSAATEAAALVHRPALTEAAATSESSVASATFAAAASETVAGYDVSGAAATWPNTRSETIAANDNASTSLVMPAARAEDVAADDDATGDVVGGAVIYDDVLSEGITASASQIATATMVTSRAESLTAAAAQTSAATWAATRSEAFSAAEVSQGATGIGLALSEGLSSTASQIVAGVFIADRAELLAANDDQDVGVSFDDALAETAIAEDQAAATGGIEIQPPEVPASRHATTRPGLTAATTTTTNRSAASDPDLRTATTSKGRRAA